MTGEASDLPALRHFMMCYWPETSDLLWDSFGEAVASFCGREPQTMLSKLRADLAEARRRRMIVDIADSAIMMLWRGMGGSYLTSRLATELDDGVAAALDARAPK